MGSLYILSCLILCIVQSRADETHIACYDDRGRPQRCIPPFENAAFKVEVEASNTCALKESEEYCLQTSVTGATKSCHVCDAHDRSRSHPATYLTDFHDSKVPTWWQSQTMLQEVQYPNSVNLTLNLGKSFDITYVRLKFYSSRPDSFAIYKRSSLDAPWVAYQFYSASCEDTYGKRNKEIITIANEAKAICTDEFSDISPLTAGSVAFSTLEGRPSAYNFEHSQELQEWVTATDIKIVLNRLNTFGDEVFGDPNVLKSYFYAISDFAVGARCKCNGHASECVRSTGQGLEEKSVCRCEHDTQGHDCGECQPFYNDRPWKRATADGAHECIACDCNGLSNRCFFDEKLYRKTGHGGHCLDCRENTFGIHCERCKDYFYRAVVEDKCQACNCHAIGALYRQCDESGKCQCKRGVTGDKCDRCDVNYYDFGQSGCRPCQCEIAGSLENHAECLPDSGICKCKEFVEGQNCDRCQPGYFAMSADNPQGCISCFCYGHSSVCSSAPGYTAKVVQSQFNTGRQRWKGIERSGKELALDYNGVTQQIGISSLGIESSYFLAPARYLGNLKFSYDQVLSFTLRVGSDSARASVLDVILEGNGQQISLPIFAQGNAIPRTVNQEYKFRLNEHPNYEWTPNLSSLEFIKLLSNVTALKIRGTYNPIGYGFIDNVKLGSAHPGRSAGGRAVSHVELCQCPEGYVGQFCESCAPGYHRDPPSGGPFARCVPCNCNGHSDTCDVNTGRCICQHNTVGLNCERCLPGYYGYALAGTPDDCKVCPCPDNGECVEMINGEVACINCKEGYTGNRCEICADGYYGDPQGKYGPSRPCQKCICNENIDPNAVANCNSTTGKCLKCILNTAGFACAQCLPGYYGDALSLPKGQCKACDCYNPGSQGDGLSSCAARSGQCPCLPNVSGLKCDKCWDGYWNIDSGRGCERCGCDPLGSYNQSCDVTTGQCLCKPGVGGRACDHCIEYYYGFSEDGCQMCSCDPVGSHTMQCDEVTGDCQCKTNIIGRRCDRCQENKFNISAGCIDCPVCYNLVQDRVNIHRRKLHELRMLIHQINDNPKVVDDSEFRAKLDATAATVDDLLEEARKTGGTDGTLADQLDALKAAIADVISQCGDITTTMHQAGSASKNGIVDISAAEEAISAAEDALRNAHSHIETDGVNALEKAVEAQGKYGHESTRMTEIAKEARMLAERQEKEAANIEDMANLALNTSQDALRIAQESLHMPTYVADDLGQLQTNVFDAEQLFESTRNLAVKALKEAEEAYKLSLSLYTDADSVVVPTVDVDMLVTEADEIKTEAAEIKADADELREQQRAMMADVSKQIQSAEEMLEGGIRQQQVADELLADADAARAMARDAIDKAEKTLEDAKKALRTFREFDEKIRQSKLDAEDAIHQIPSIEDKIAEAEAKTYTARNNLADAEADANMARDLAEDAQNIADMASAAASNISTEAATTKQRAIQLNDEAVQLSRDVDGATVTLENYEQQANQDAQVVREALEKADEAKTGATESSQRVKTALNTVEDILSQLSNLDSIDSDMLSELELNLYDAEQAIVDADIETRYNDMLASRHQQNIWVRDYTDELIQLRKDVENIKQINDSIPLGCYKSIKLEPVG